MGTQIDVNSIQTGVLHLAQTRFQRAIGFAIQLNPRHITRGQELGVVYWLPAPTEANVNEAIDLILRERYGLQFEKSPPSWLNIFETPNMQPIINGIREKEATIKGLIDQLKIDQSRLAQESRFLKLLYEQGEDVLEPIVRDTLRELGAVVENPKQRGREDGRLIDPFGNQGMLEIKGRSGNLRQSDVRELDNWVRDAIANESYQSKGILIANLKCNEDPRERNNIIPPNCAEAAKVFDISIVTTTQLFQALVLDQNGQLDRQAFWEQIFVTKGVLDLSGIV